MSLCVVALIDSPESLRGGWSDRPRKTFARSAAMRVQPNGLFMVVVALWLGREQMEIGRMPRRVARKTFATV
jgi:hypothetical protein